MEMRNFPDCVGVKGFRFSVDLTGSIRITIRWKAGVTGKRDAAGLKRSRPLLVTGTTVARQLRGVTSGSVVRLLGQGPA